MRKAEIYHIFNKPIFFLRDVRTLQNQGDTKNIRFCESTQRFKLQSHPSNKVHKQNTKKETPKLAGEQISWTVIEVQSWKPIKFGFGVIDC